jgi:TetR/AcrR family transcriptional repressor of nem operon
MRYSAEHKDKSYGKIVLSASRLMRTHGVAEVSIAKVMTEAGLTQGAFYAHFESKTDLATTAIATALNESRNNAVEQVRKARAQGRSAAHTLIDFYLNEKHLESPWRGCGLSAISQEVGREPSPMRDAMRERLQDLVATFSPDMAGETQAEREAAVELLYSTMVGIVTLARLCNTPAERLAYVERSKQLLLRMMKLA